MTYKNGFPGMTAFQRNFGGKSFTSDIKATPFRQSVLLTDKATSEYLNNFLKK